MQNIAIPTVLRQSLLFLLVFNVLTVTAQEAVIGNALKMRLNQVAPQEELHLLVDHRVVGHEPVEVVLLFRVGQFALQQHQR